jgi:Tfp pilus assembly protein PilO
MSRPRVRFTVILGTLIIAALATVVWFLVLSPRMSQASDVETQVDQLGIANATLQARYHTVVKQAADAPALAAQAQTEFSKMPQQADLPAVITQLAAAATDAGITPEGIQVINTGLPNPVGAAEPGAAPAGINLARMAISMTVKGTPAQVFEFATNLQGLDRALLMTSTNMTWERPPDGPPQGVMQVQGTMFVLQSQLPDLVANVKELLVNVEATPTVAG